MGEHMRNELSRENVETLLFPHVLYYFFRVFIASRAGRTLGGVMCMVGRLDWAERRERRRVLLLVMVVVI